jgi:hypothetical protein
MHERGNAVANATRGFPLRREDPKSGYYTWFDTGWFLSQMPLYVLDTRFLM